MPATNSSADAPTVVVVGSIHQDLIVNVTALPQPGETVIGTRHFRSRGGKGANQAVAASRLGATVAMLGQVGDDPDGVSLRSGLEEEGIDLTGVVVDDHLATGLAVVTVDDHGENAIVVSPGASGALSAATVGIHGDLVRKARVVLMQLEVDISAVIAAAELATGIVVLNPAPAQRLPDTLLDRVDVLVPNRVELARITGADRQPTTLGEVEDLARPLGDRCAVVVTLGPQGALALRNERVHHFPAPVVDTIDTTGAGDALCGALSAGIAEGADLFETLPLAVNAAALSTTRAGAQTSLPRQSDLARFSSS